MNKQCELITDHIQESLNNAIGMSIIEMQKKSIT